MPVLNMYLDKFLIERIDLCYDGLLTISEKEKYQERLVNEMTDRHRRKIILTQTLPVFYISGVESKMNGNIYKKM